MTNNVSHINDNWGEERCIEFTEEWKLMQKINRNCIRIGQEKKKEN
jgi:hypothetical protein